MKLIYYFLPLVLLVLFSVCHNTGATTPNTTTANSTPSEGVDIAFRISPPDIYPTDRFNYTGEVLIKMVANQRHSDIFYTRDGSIPTNASSFYFTPFSLFTPGKWTIRAIAYPRFGRMLAPSEIRERTYNVLPSRTPAPLANPERGSYRGKIQVKLTPAPGTEGSSTRVQYVVDVEDPGDQWQVYAPNQPILLDSPGEHLITARTVIGDGKSGNTSPTARYRYIITPPLVYDVFTECVKCNKLPTVGAIFTVFLQGATMNSRVFLTTSSKGCQNERHKLDDTDYVTVKPRQLHYHFITYGDAEPRVYVCLREPGAAKFIMVPRRAKASDSAVSDGSFAIEPPNGAVNTVTGFTQDPDKTVLSVDNVKFTYSSNGGSGAGSTFSVISFAVLFMVLMGTGYTIWRFFHRRNPLQHREGTHV